MITTSLAGLKIKATDARALLGEFREIFINEIYGFAYNDSERPPRIIDGGGYIGLSALYFKQCYPAASITVFEPHPQIASMLSENLIKNNVRDVTVVQVALGRESKLERFSGDDDSGRLDEAGTTLIAVKKLSEYLNEPIDFLKLNIEGSEGEVINELEAAGKLPTINKLCIEWHSFARHEQNLGSLLSILERNGFRYFINDFNRQINPALKTPFNVSDDNEYFLLIYAQKTGSPA